MVTVPRNEIPGVFRARLLEHNRSCWIAAILSLWCAGIGWAILSALYTAVALLFGAIGSGGSFEPPPWFYHAGLCGMSVLLVCAALERWLLPFQALSDRPIIGWHLIVDGLLFPARMTFMIWDHLGARTTLSRVELEETWLLMQMISKTKRADSSRLAADFPNSTQRAKMLTALQCIGWIDLHQGEEDWYYCARDDQKRTLSGLMASSEPS
ncbi:MAG TPA: hypothetical protein VIS99_05045 [Terrimicrobiaceae bacterium]